MFQVKTFLQNPYVIYPGPEQVRQGVFTKYFFDMEDQKNNEEIKRIVEKRGNVYGCVHISLNNKVILDDEIMERLPLYWIMWIETIEDYLQMTDVVKTVAMEPYFSLTKSDNNCLTFSYGGGFYSFLLPEKEFLIAVLQGGRNFFARYLELRFTPYPLSAAEKLESLIMLVNRL
ncbi:hypothetical protein QT711_11785 [Sporosarcina saromensis]|uniref:Uncharacterized protein n=1 Tax=Sporosarcina saromensis TaxID=359365 RepID=A0ABU4GA53_9BACL|nr:hypothetical protein [Sporosarcina saromensis]MDW0113869.1 hypothetical protein [Sporosarcina saromensis]